MAGILDEAQLEAVRRLRNGNILCGGVGSGKSRTALAYYFCQNDGWVSENGIRPMKKHPQDLYIITTARKRDTLEWEMEMPQFGMLPGSSIYDHRIVIDSWNNIHKYTKVQDAFFIFDEQRVVGKGVWAKSFKQIAKWNDWILLSATPGDTWMDYMQVFIANGFYRNQQDFIDQHVVYSPRVKFPKVDRYLNTGRLIRLRDKILVDIDKPKHTVQHHMIVRTQFKRVAYQTILKTRWCNRTGKPIENASELCSELRRVVNADESRKQAVLDIFAAHPKLIVFYNYNYERDILLGLDYGEDVEIAEWNGFKHQPVPEGDKWVYLVQYNAGAEGWNCISTDTILFYSQSYSYRVMTQACGRIDRMNTLYTDLYYYHLSSYASIDLSIEKALKEKKQFNETKFSQRYLKGA